MGYITILYKKILLLFRWVDQEVVEVLKRRKDACYVHEGPDARVKCAEMYEEFQVAVEDYFTKCKCCFKCKFAIPEAVYEILK